MGYYLDESLDIGGHASLADGLSVAGRVSDAVTPLAGRGLRPGRDAPGPHVHELLVVGRHGGAVVALRLRLAAARRRPQPVKVEHRPVGLQGQRRAQVLGDVHLPIKAQ